MARKNGLVNALIFLAGFGLALNAAASFPGWGEAPEIALSVVALKRAAFFGFPLFQSMCSFFSSILPVDSKIFAFNIFGAALFGFCATMALSAVKKLSGSAFAGTIAAVAFMLRFSGLSFFTTLTPASWSIFLLFLIMFLTIHCLVDHDQRFIHALIIVAGFAVFHSGVTLVAAVCAIAVAVLFDKKYFVAPTSWSSFALLFFAGASSLIFVLMRPPLLINFTSKLPPWLGTISPANDVASRILNPGGLGDVIPGFLALTRILTGPFFVFSICWLLSLFFMKKTSITKYLFYFPIPFIFLLLITRPENRSFYSETLCYIFLVYGSAGIFMIFNEPGKKTGSRAPAIILLVALLPALNMNFSSVIKENFFSKTKSSADYLHKINRDEMVYSGNDDVSYTELFRYSNNRNVRKDILWKGRLSIPRIFEREAGGSREYFYSMLKSMKRDSLLVADPGQDRLNALAYYRETLGLRKDVDVIFTEWIINREYRENIWRNYASVFRIPNRKEYSKLLGQVASMAKPIGSTGMSKSVRQRITEGMTDILNDAIIVQNNNRRPICYNRIDSVINSQMYKVMYFEPRGGLFHLLIYAPVPFDFDRFANMATSRATDDPVGRQITATYFRNIGEHFFSQDKPVSAMPLLEACLMLNRKDISCNFFLGLIYKSWGRYEDAEKTLSRALDLINQKKFEAGQDSGDILMMARIYRELGKDTDAEKYEKMVEPSGAMTSPPANNRLKE